MKTLTSTTEIGNEFEETTILYATNNDGDTPRPGDGDEPVVPIKPKPTDPDEDEDVIKPGAF